MTARTAPSRSVIAAVVAATMTLGACAQNPDGTTPNLFSDISSAFGGDDANLTPEQQALRQQERDYSESRLASAAIGAGAGALIGALLGAAVGGRDGAIVGAGLGLAAGGAAGYAGGTYLTRDHQDFAASRDTLQADIDAANADTEKMKKNVQVAQAALSGQRAAIDKLRADLRAGRITEQQARAQAKTAADDLAAVRALADESDRRVANLSQSVGAYRQAGIRSGDLDRQLASQKQQLASLRSVERSMLGAINRTPANVRPTV